MIAKDSLEITIYLATSWRIVEEDSEIQHLNGKTGAINGDHKETIWMNHW